MPLILAIEPDKRQSGQLASVVKGLHAELVHGTRAADALQALHGRVPDLVLTTSLISPRDDAALAAHLRELGPAAAHVQTVTIPLLGTAAPVRPKGGMLAALRREKAQAPMTDGCSPEVFAEQIRQYLATAEEQKAAAATRSSEPALDEPVFEEFPEPLVETPSFVAPVEEPVEVADIEAAPEPEVETTVEPEPVVEPEVLVADEPAGLPLSQLLQLVSDTAPAAESDAPVADPLVEMVAEPGIAPEPEPEPIAELIAAPVSAIAPEWRSEDGWEPELQTTAEPECVEPEPPASKAASDFGDLFVDPAAAQALDELSRQAPASSIADGIPGEPPVPVVEMHRFQSLDSIASELAAGPSPRYESLDDLASLFAAKPAAATPAVAPVHGDNSQFASLFAEPAPVRVATPIDVPGIDPGLFASAPAAPLATFEAPEPGPAFVIEPEPVTAYEPEPGLIAAPEPIVLAAPEPIVLAAPEPAIEPEPVVAFEPIVSEPVIQEFEPEPEPVAVAAEPLLDEEISLDVDAFQFTPLAPAEPAEPPRFSFTFVDGFGDALSDFEVPTIAAVAADLGVGEHLPLDLYAARPSSVPAAARQSVEERAAAPMLDAEALSMIGDAARKVGLDALVIEEFERGLNSPRPKKVKKKAHAGATQVPAAPAPAPKPAKRPVQDEWGMFDPEQCGFAALEDDEEGSDARPTTGTRVRVISY